MKRFFLLNLILLGMLSSSMAQNSSNSSKKYVEKGQRYVSLNGLSLGYRGVIRDPRTGNILYGGVLDARLSFGYGKMLTDRLMLGARGGYNGTISLQKATSSSLLDRYQGAYTEAFARYYISRGRWSPFAEVGVGTGIARLATDSPTWVASLYQEAKLGVLFHVNEKVSLEASYGIRFTQYKGLNQGASWNFGRTRRSFPAPTIGINFRL